MNLDAIQSIMEQLIEQTCSDNLRLYRNDRVCCIETSEGESFSAYVNEFGFITLNSHFTGSNVINGRTSTSKLCISLTTFEIALEYNMMHYFPDYIDRLKKCRIMGGLNMANINFQIEEFFRRDIYKFLELIPARNYEVSVMSIPETGETSISLIFYGGHLLQEEAYRLRVTYSDIQGVLKPDGHLDIMYLQYLLDTFLTMAKEYRRSPK